MVLISAADPMQGQLTKSMKLFMDNVEVGQIATLPSSTNERHRLSRPLHYADQSLMTYPVPIAGSPKTLTGR